MTFHVNHVREHPFELVNYKGLHRGACKDELTPFITFDKIRTTFRRVLREKRFENIGEGLEPLVVRVFVESIAFIEDDDGGVNVIRGVFRAFDERMRESGRCREYHVAKVPRSIVL